MKTVNVITNRYIAAEKFVRDYDFLNKEKIVLDAGAGEQRARLFIENNKYISQDFGVYKGGGVPFDYKGTWNHPWDSGHCDLICDICDIPIEDNSIDLVICFEVIEHLQEPLLAINELARIVKNNGTLLITAPNLCASHQEPYFYYSGFSKEFFIEAVPKKTPNLFVEDIYLENDFVNAHCNELTHLIASQENRLTRLFINILIKFIKLIFRFSKKLPGFNQPKSCSGFFVVYKKTVSM